MESNGFEQLPAQSLRRPAPHFPTVEIVHAGQTESCIADQRPQLDLAPGVGPELVVRARKDGSEEHVVVEWSRVGLEIVEVREEGVRGPEEQMRGGEGKRRGAGGGRGVQVGVT